jgi:class 3 adenylate cyclase
MPSGTVTFLFTDLEGSTRLWERHPEAMKAALARHDAILQAAVGAHGGQVLKMTGDGVVAVFARALDATRAAIAGQLELGREPWGVTGPLLVRMGLHTDEADERGGDYFGSWRSRTAGRSSSLGLPRRWCATSCRSRWISWSWARTA